MAQEQPNNANTGGQGNTSSQYSEVRAPQFVGGSVNPTTGNIDPSSKSLAASAPPPTPQTPTTQLANVDVPQAPSLATTAARGVVPALTADLGTKIGAGASLGDAASGVGSDVMGLGKSLTSGLNFGSSAGSSAFGSTAAPVPYLGAGGATDLGAGGSAASSAGSTATNALGSTLGGAAGAGIGSLAIGLATGENLKQAAPGAIGSAIGFAIGNVVLPGIGGFIGSALGGLFCHAWDTAIRMEDGSTKFIQNIRLGDRVLLGGKIIGIGEVNGADLYKYRDTIVNGRHAVFEQGRWLRVRDSALATPVAMDVRVYPLVSERHLLVTAQYICADFAETDHEDFSLAARIRVLNGDEARNAQLEEVEFTLRHGARDDDKVRPAA